MPGALAYLHGMSDEADRDPDPRTLEDWVRHAAAEPIFRPVMVVIGLVAVTLGAGILRIALADRNIPALAALAILLWMSVDFVRHDWTAAEGGKETGPEDQEPQGTGLVSKLVIGWWLASAIAAVAFPILY